MRLRDQLVCPSTRAFLQEGRRTKGFSLFDLVHGYVYGRWPYLYIGIGTGEHWLARVFGPLARLVSRLLPRTPGPEEDRITFADTYHGKVVPTEAARQLVTVGEDIRLTDLEKVIPYKLARDIVLQNPDHIVALECPCRSSRANPCLPLDVCLVIGEPFARFVVEHHPRRARWITQEQAVGVLEQERDRGHVHHAFFKDAMFGRFYAICNCCSCCCGAMHAHRNGTPMLAPSGYVAVLQEELCVGCGSCGQVCPFEALEMEEAIPKISVEACMGCGLCVSACEQEALSLSRAESKGEPLEVRDLLERSRSGLRREAAD